MSVAVGWRLRWVRIEQITDETDILFAKAVTEDGHVLMYSVPLYKDVPVADLRSWHLGDAELEDLWLELDKYVDSEGMYEIELPDDTRY